MTGILNFFPAIAVNSPFAVLIPTFIIMLIGVTKEFIGELKRYKDDKVVNATPVKKLVYPNSPNKGNGIEFEKTVLADVKVGDII